MLFVIEHLEPKLSEWLLIEYSHAKKIVGKNLLITNVKMQRDFKRLSKIARVERAKVGEIFKSEELVVLDPKGKRGFSREDLRGKRAIVIGGILGEDPPLGRTRELLTKRLRGACIRNLGKGQLSIDGATYMAKRVCEGKRLEELPVQYGLEIQINEVYSTFLPYAFPLVRGRPLISRELVAYLKRK